MKDKPAEALLNFEQLTMDLIVLERLAGRGHCQSPVSRSFQRSVLQDNSEPTDPVTYP